jgi:hypothetical protein
LFCCLLGLSLQGMSARAADEPTSLAAYWKLVGESRDTIHALTGQSAQVIHAGLLNLAARWEKIHQVRLENGSLLDIDTSFWTSQFRAEKPDLPRLVTDLDALLAAQISASGTSPDAALARLREILARPEFQPQQQESPDWANEMLSRFLKWLSRILDQAPTVSTSGNLALQAFGVLAAVLVLSVLAYTLRGLFADLASDSTLDLETGTTGLPLNAQAAFTRAEGLSDQGDYRSAVRYLYLSALLILDERGWLYYDRTRTNREYLRDLSTRPETASLLRAVIDVFDRVWYGFQPLDIEDYKAYARQVNELKEQK